MHCSLSKDVVSMMSSKQTHFQNALTRAIPYNETCNYLIPSSSALTSYS